MRNLGPAEQLPKEVKITMSFDVYALTPYARKVGKVCSNGEVIDAEGNRVGKIFSDGKIKTITGKIIGIATREGKLDGPLAKVDIRFDLKGYAYAQGKMIGMVKEIDKGIPKVLAQLGGSALLLAPDINDPTTIDTLISAPSVLSEQVEEAKSTALKRQQELQTVKGKSPAV